MGEVVLCAFTNDPERERGIRSGSAGLTLTLRVRKGAPVLTLAVADCTVDSGKPKANVQPWPTPAECSHIFPLCLSMIAFVRTIPRPLPPPPSNSFGLKRTMDLKIFFASSFAMPTPLSRTDTIKNLCCSVSPSPPPPTVDTLATESSSRPVKARFSRRHTASTEVPSRSM